MSKTIEVNDTLTGDGKNHVRAVRMDWARRRRFAQGLAGRGTPADRRTVQAADVVTAGPAAGHQIVKPVSPRKGDR